MYTQITFSTFCDAFRDYDRNDNFTYEGKRALFDYLESYEDDTGDKVELDVIALCGDYNEDPLSDVLKNYELESLEELEESTSVINFDEETGLVLYQVY